MPSVRQLRANKVTTFEKVRGADLSPKDNTLNCFDANQQTDLANVIQAYFGDFMNAHRQEFTALVGQAGEQVNGIYEADYREFNRETYVRGREAFDRTYAELKEILIGSWWRDEQLAKAARDAAE